MFPKEVGDHKRGNFTQKCFYLVTLIKSKDETLGQKFSEELKSLKPEDSWEFYNMLVAEYQKLMNQPDLTKVGPSKPSKPEKKKEETKKKEEKKAAPSKKVTKKKVVKKVSSKPSTPKKAAKKSVKKTPAKATSKKTAKKSSKKK